MSSRRRGATAVCRAQCSLPWPGSAGATRSSSCTCQSAAARPSPAASSASPTVSVRHARAARRRTAMRATSRGTMGMCSCARARACLLLLAHGSQETVPCGHPQPSAGPVTEWATMCTHKHSAAAAATLACCRCFPLSSPHARSHCAGAGRLLQLRVGGYLSAHGAARHRQQSDRLLAGVVTRVLCVAPRARLLS